MPQVLCGYIGTDTVTLKDWAISVKKCLEIKSFWKVGKEWDFWKTNFLMKCFKEKIIKVTKYILVFWLYKNGNVFTAGYTQKMFPFRIKITF